MSVPAPGNTVRCLWCNHQNNKGDRCEKCNAQLKGPTIKQTFSQVVTDQYITCSHCRASNPKSETWCTVCASHLRNPLRPSHPRARLRPLGPRTRLGRTNAQEQPYDPEHNWQFENFFEERTPNPRAKHRAEKKTKTGSVAKEFFESQQKPSRTPPQVQEEEDDDGDCIVYDSSSNSTPSPAPYRPVSPSPNYAAAASWSSSFPSARGFPNYQPQSELDGLYDDISSSAHYSTLGVSCHRCQLVNEKLGSLWCAKCDTRLIPHTEEEDEKKAPPTSSSFNDATSDIYPSVPDYSTLGVSCHRCGVTNEILGAVWCTKCNTRLIPHTEEDDDEKHEEPVDFAGAGAGAGGQPMDWEEEEEKKKEARQDAIARNQAAMAELREQLNLEKEVKLKAQAEKRKRELERRMFDRPYKKRKTDPLLLIPRSFQCLINAPIRQTRHTRSQVIQVLHELTFQALEEESLLIKDLCGIVIEYLGTSFEYEPTFGRYLEWSKDYKDHVFELMQHKSNGLLYDHDFLNFLIRLYADATIDPKRKPALGFHNGPLPWKLIRDETTGKDELTAWKCSIRNLFVDFFKGCYPKATKDQYVGLFDQCFANFHELLWVLTQPGCVGIAQLSPCDSK